MTKILKVAVVVISLGVLANADTVVVFGSRADQNPTDIIDWTQLGPALTSLTTPQFVTTFSGNLALAGNINGNNFLRVDEGNGWTGNFDFGESLVWTCAGSSSAGSSSAGPGPFALVLQNPVGSFGFSIQTDEYGPFAVDVQAVDASNNVLFDHIFNGFSTNLENGSALFVGLGDATGVNISQILISTTSQDSFFANDFAIDDPSFTYVTATPEPRSMAVLLSALLAVAAIVRRSKK